MALDMRPSSIVNNLTNYRLASTELFRYISLFFSFSPRSYLNDVTIREEAFAICLSTRLTTLRNHIEDIVGVCTKKKMIGVHTSTVVASVANEKTIWDWANIKLIAKSMGKNQPLSSSSKIKFSIALAICVTSPFPASMERNNGDLLEKTILWGPWMSWHLRRIT